MRATIKSAIAIVSVILVVSLVANAYLYFFVNNGLQKQVTDLQSQMVNLQNQTNSIKNENSSLQSEKADFESQVANLTNQLAVLQEQLNSSQSIIDTLKTENIHLQNQFGSINDPYLVTSLGTKDINSPGMLNPSNSNNRLFIEGTVVNTGNQPAYDCKLHVTAYRGEAIVIDTDIVLGTIFGESSASVSSNLSYLGASLTYWNLTPEWSNSP